MHIEEEDFERPESVGSLSKLIEKVKFDSTPTAEKELDFGMTGSLSTEDGVCSVATPEPPQLELPHLEDDVPMSFQHFLFTSNDGNSPDENQSPDEVLELSMSKVKLAHGLGLEYDFEQQRTPTQQGFFE